MTAAFLLLLLAAPHLDADVVVVSPLAYRQALQPWLQYRTQQGHRIALISSSESPEEIRRQVREVAQGKRLRFVVLVGDACYGFEKDAARRACCVPVHLAEAKVDVLWGSEPYLATDNWYADLDDDQVPDVAIGRLTAGSPEQLQQIVAKTLAYERCGDFGLWRRQLNFVAGVGGFGPVADMVLESATRYFLTQNIPAPYRVSMTYANWRSPYCPDPRRFQATALERLNEGSWFWVYIGHGQPYALDHFRVPGGEYPIFDVTDVPKLHCAHAGPIALFLSCYAGAIDAQGDCLAKQMLCQPGGPVAVVAGSRVTMPYAMSVLATGLLDEVFHKHCATLGEALLGAKRAMLREPEASDPQRAMLDSIAAALSPSPQQLAAERQEHVLLFNLIGDPLLRLRYPKNVQLAVASQTVAGRPLAIGGVSPLRGRATIELLTQHGQLTFPAPSRQAYPQAADALAEFQETYRRANDVRLAAVELPVPAGRFEAQLDVPRDISGDCHLAVVVEGDDDFALAAADVKIER